jgi:Leucine-rich repeat (LRR) protein
MFEKMKILNLSHSHYLSQTPDFSGLPNLEQLILEDCTSLFKVHHSIGALTSLVLVNLKGCKCLTSLPRSFYKLKSLETLILSGSLPSLFWSWMLPRKCLKPINLLSTALKDLRLRKCNLSDNAIPTDVWSLCPLEILDLGCNSFESLPPSLGGLLKLGQLILDDCKKLKSIPDLPASLYYLDADNCTKLERISNPSKLLNLFSLSFANCRKLLEIPSLEKWFNPIRFVDTEEFRNLTNTFKQNFLQVQVSLTSFFIPC